MIRSCPIQMAEVKNNTSTPGVDEDINSNNNHDNIMMEIIIIIIIIIMVVE